MIGCALLCDLRYLALHAEIAVGVIRVLDAERHLRAGAHIAVLLAPARAVDQEILAVILHPDRRDLRRTVGVYGGEMGIGPFLQKVCMRFRNLSHGYLLVFLSAVSIVSQNDRML